MTYIKKILQDKLCTDKHSHTHPLPMSKDKEYNKTIESATPLDDKELLKIEKEYGFSYRQDIGKLIYAMMICRPDMSFPLIKLSQYSSAPVRVHFQGFQGIFNYLRKTITEGIYFWRKIPRQDLPEGDIPTCKEANNYTPQTREQAVAENIRTIVDSYYAGDTSHRRSVTGITVKITGGCIYYKKGSRQRSLSLSLSHPQRLSS